jgi:hypothetical protein
MLLAFKVYSAYRSIFPFAEMLVHIESTGIRFWLRKGVFFCYLLVRQSNGQQRFGVMDFGGEGADSGEQR